MIYYAYISTQIIELFLIGVLVGAIIAISYVCIDLGIKKRRSK